MHVVAQAASVVDWLPIGAAPSYGQLAIAFVTLAAVAYAWASRDGADHDLGRKMLMHALTSGLVASYLYAEMSGQVSYRKSVGLGAVSGAVLATSAVYLFGGWAWARQGRHRDGTVSHVRAIGALAGFYTVMSLVYSAEQVRGGAWYGTPLNLAVGAVVLGPAIVTFCVKHVTGWDGSAFAARLVVPIGLSFLTASGVTYTLLSSVETPTPAEALPWIVLWSVAGAVGVLLAVLELTIEPAGPPDSGSSVSSAAPTKTRAPRPLRARLSL